MKIVVITSSPHPQNESTSIYLADRFTEGAKSARHYSRTEKLHGKKSIMMATAYNSADWTMEALANHYETLVRYMEWQDVGQVWATGCGARSLVEKSSFAEMAYKIGANL